MAKVNVDGLNIAYEIIGDGPKTAAITPGGRFSKDTPGVRDLAQEIAREGYRVLIWDRPNCGESDLCLSGASESIVNADTLAALLRKLDMAPALVFGGSAGSRVSLIMARRHPDVVRKLALLWISGGWTSLSGLVGVYCGNAHVAAAIGGMEAVANDVAWQENVQRNPTTREKLLAQDVDQFIETMQAWGKSYLPLEGSPVPGLSPEDFAHIGVPTLVFRGGQSDPHHPRYTTDGVHELLPDSKLVDPPWGDREWIERMLDGENGLFRRWALLAPQLLEFDRE